ncbi:filamentous hemagglutinin family outer membrane protein [Kalymmatonema gypsitolerans NIES-4073]|nr:filamentous hemagglutinin family outer membrane protein [Scytonema sp. NIES-4073]
MFAISTRWGCLLGITIASAYVSFANCVNAQITPDSTLPNNSSVTIQDNIRTIEGGTQAGSNLFHSFKEFSVPTGSTAFFNNAAGIQNILSRVTGGSVSNIDGLIKANGTANLFLINPNGIIFGPNASLNIGGSFIGSTASSINFADGTKFSATPSQDKPLLTITAPIGLGLGTNPGEIQVRGAKHDINFPDIKKQPRDPVNSSVPGLELQSGNTLALVGGKVSVEGGVLKSPAGRVEIGSVASNGTVNLVPVQEGWRLGYEGTPSFGDIQFSGRSFVDTTGVGGGSIAVAGKNISLTGESILLAETRGQRNGQEISIVGDSISVISSEINTATFSSGNAGQVKLVANKSILLENNGGAGANTHGLGKAGEITLKADSIEVRKSSGLGSSTFGEGDAGRIEVKANSLLIDNAGFGASSEGEGNAGEMNIAVGDFVLSNYAGLGVETKGAGNAGKINVTANSLRISDKSQLTSVSENTGDAGKINITANSLLISDFSGFTSATTQDSTGQPGEINLNVAGPVVFRNFAGISINNQTLGTGNAGKINITANSLLIEDNSGFSSGTQNTGQAGEININVAGSLVLRNYSGIDSNTYGTVNAGQITVSAESLEISNVSGIGTKTEGSGNAGKLYVRVKTLFLDNDGRFRLESTGNGNAGTLEIVADTIQLDNHSLIDATTTSGNGGDLRLNVSNLLLLRRGSQISTTAGTQEAGGNGGNITINAPNGFIVAVSNENSDITANAYTGSGGRVDIKAFGIYGIQRRQNQTSLSDITASSKFGVDGTIELNTPEIDPDSGLVNLPSVPVDTEVAQGCNSPNYAQSSFIITGRGGLPPNPKDILTPDAVLVDWVTLNPNFDNRKSPSVSTPTKPTPEPIVEATGWVFNAKGEVVLTADAPTTTPRNSWSPSARCRAS